MFLITLSHVKVRHSVACFLRARTRLVTCCVSHELACVLMNVRAVDNVVTRERALFGHVFHTYLRVLDSLFFCHELACAL